MSGTDEQAVERSADQASGRVEVKPHMWTDGGAEVLILRRCNPDGTSSHGFKWNIQPGEINSAPDWNCSPVCGGGLHGWPWGMGLGQGSDFDVINDLFVVFAADSADVVGELESSWKCKVKTCRVIASGTFGKCWGVIEKGRDRLIQAMSKSTVADFSSGERSMAASSGDASTAASSGYASKAASSGYASTAASSGYASKAASSGYASTAASSGDASTAECKGKETLAAVAGLFGSAKVGEAGAFALAFKDEKGVLRFAVGVVGENAVEADTWYRVESGKIVKA